MYEIMRDYDGADWVGFENDDIIIASLEDLASGVAVGGGSVKENTKKERKAQRSSFRAILVSFWGLESDFIIFRNMSVTLKIRQLLPWNSIVKSN